jgi:hypothetical protein
MGLQATHLHDQVELLEKLIELTEAQLEKE